MEQKPNSGINQWVNSVVNLHIKMLYEPSIDLGDSNVYTKFGLMLFTHSQDIEQNPYFDINQGSYSVANMHKKHLQSQLRSCQ